MNTENEIITAAFTRRGINLALRLGYRVFVPERLACEGTEAITESLNAWAGRYFHSVRALIFVGACGIAVRAIAPHVESKLSDPAVIVIDESGRFVIPVLSGHIGGANELARMIADKIHAQAVITTATDVNNIIAVDEWAVRNECVIENPENIKYISGSMLEGHNAGVTVAHDSTAPSEGHNANVAVTYDSTVPSEGHNVGVAITCDNIPVPFPVTLWLRPKMLVLGAGCHKGVNADEFERSAVDFLDGAGVSILSLRAIASIDIKANEPALISFAEKHNIPFVTFSADELNALPGKFSGSAIVKSITGTDNICERACMLSAGEGAVLLRSKCVYDNMTFALSRCCTQGGKYSRGRIRDDK